MRLTTADLVVLSVYLYDGAMHGYELIKRLDASNLSEWAAVSKPQVYYSLRKLVKSGHLEKASDSERSHGPDRTVYRPTKKAENDMQSQLGKHDWMETRAPSPFVTWSALALHADKATIKAQLRRRRAFLAEQIKSEEDTLVALEQTSGQNILVAREMVILAIGQMNAEMDQLPELEMALLKKSKR